MKYPVTWITPGEINDHIESMHYHSAQIDKFKEILNPPKKEEEKPPLSKMDKIKINNWIDIERKALRFEELVLKIKLRFFYQNSSGIALAPNSEVRRPHAFTREEYMVLKRANFNRHAIAQATYLQLQKA